MRGPHTKRVLEFGVADARGRLSWVSVGREVDGKGVARGGIAIAAVCDEEVLHDQGHSWLDSLI